MTALIRIATRVLSLVRPCQAKGDIRYHINGIRIEPNPAGGAIAVATDGRRMAVALDPKGECLQPMTLALPDEAWRHCDKTTCDAIDGRQLVVRVDPTQAPTDDFGDLLCGPMLRGYSIEIAHAPLPQMRCWVAPEPRVAIIDGKFPDWRRVLPGTAEAWAALGPAGTALNVQYVADLARMVPKKTVYGQVIRFWQAPMPVGETLNPGVVLVQFHDAPELVVAIMPMGRSCELWKLPDFIERAK